MTLPLDTPRPASRRLAGLLALALLASGPTCPPPADPARVLVLFELEHDLSARPDRAVYVAGSLPELGENDLARAVKLVSDDGVQWRIRVSLPVNRAYTHRFWEGARDLPGFVVSPAPIGEEQAGSTPSVPLAPRAKSLHAHTSLESPALHWRQDDGAFQTASMQLVGPGRAPGESRWAVRGFGEARHRLEFYLTGAAGSRDPAGAGTYRTPLDVVFLQDQQLFSYRPAASVSPPRRDYDVLPSCLSSTQLESAILGEPREYRVFLPRGYDEHTQRRYPVLYLLDGQALWDDCIFPPGDIDGPLDPDGSIVAELIRLGEAGEVIQVGVDNVELGLCAWQEKRARDYSPPGDTVSIAAEENGCSVVTGAGDRHLAFVLEELKPLIDARYRTLVGGRNTYVAGFSLGGTGSMFMGWEAPDRFAGVGSLSGFYRDAPSLLERIRGESKRSLRIYLDSMQIEGVNYALAVVLRDDLVARSPGPYVVEGDLRHVVEPGFGHLFALAGPRLRHLLPFLVPGAAGRALELRPVPTP